MFFVLVLFVNTMFMDGEGRGSERVYSIESVFGENFL